MVKQRPVPEMAMRAMPTMSEAMRGLMTSMPVEAVMNPSRRMATVAAAVRMDAKALSRLHRYRGENRGEKPDAE